MVPLAELVGIELLERGGEPRTTELTQAFGLAEYREKYPERLILFVTVIAVLKWDQIELPPANSDVEVLIERHPRASLSFKVRDPGTMLPLLMIVQRGDALQLEDGWEFPPFSFSPGATLCQAPSAACDWVFLAQSLDVAVDFDSHSSIAPLRAGLIPAEASGRTVDYQVSHSAFFVQTFEGDMSCAALYSARQSFAFSPVTAEE